MEQEEEKEDRRREVNEEDCVQRTVVILKPEALAYGTVGKILNRYERKGLKIIYLKYFQFTQKIVAEQYHKYVTLPFYPNLERLLVSGISLVLVLEGHMARRVARNLNGYYNPETAQPGTIRFDFGPGIYSGTVVHASDSLLAAISDAMRLVDKKEVNII